MTRRSWIWTAVLVLLGLSLALNAFMVGYAAHGLREGAAARSLIESVANWLAGHFGGPACDYLNFEYAGTAADALAQLDRAYAAWTAGVRSLDAAALAAPCGPAEGPYAEYPMATLVLHISRETIHHGAEIALLRDLYAHRR